jgi:hypothetical protein
MKSTNLILTAFFFIALLASCKKDVEGCTDPKAANYNPDATVGVNCKYNGCTDKDAENYDAQANVSTECVYARDKFIGSYAGTLTCPGSLSLLTGATTFTIDENIAGGKNDVNVLITTSTLTVPIKGVCSGNIITIDADLKKVTIPTPLGSVEADIKAKGVVTFDAAKNEISGPLTLTTVSVFGTVADTCPFFGKKN